MIRRSDAYVLNEDYSLTMNPERKKAGLSENLVSLDDNFYKKIKSFEKLFPAYPSLVYSNSLKVEGEIEFDAPIVLKGDVTFKNKSGSLKKISSLGRKEFKDEVVEL